MSGLQYSSTRYHSRWHDIRVVVHRGIVPDPPISVGEEHPAGRLRFEILDYQTPDKARVRQVPVAHGGVLARLHHLSITLAQRYRWQPAQATAFVLTGLPPTLSAIDATWDPAFFQTQAGDVTALSRIVLTIDPTLSPKEYAQLFSGYPSTYPGVKMARFNREPARACPICLAPRPGGAVATAYGAWNTEFQQWSYANLGNFKRDYLNAIQKLLAPIPLANELLLHTARKIMPKRRANHEGTIYKRQDGRWVASVTLPGGKRKSFYGQTRQEVAQKLTVGLKARLDGMPLPSDQLKVGRYLQEWLQSTQPSIRPSTWRRYEQLLRLYAIPTLGTLPLTRLEPRHVQRLYADCLAQGLAPATVRQLHAVLRRALGQATKWGTVARNVAALVSPPAGEAS